VRGEYEAAELVDDERALERTTDDVVWGKAYARARDR
jgi:hypothetical protein